MSDAPVPGADDLVEGWLLLPELAEALGSDLARVRQLVREHQVLAFRRDGGLCVPGAFVHDGRLLKGLPGLLTVLADGGFSDEEALAWLFTPDESLPGRPVDALRENRGTEVKRRAQAAGL